MQKKSFRPKKPASPSYPLLREVDHHTVSRWGLATLGGLLLGGATCTPANADPPMPGVPPRARVEQKDDGKAVRLPDAGAPTVTTVVHMGKTSAPRVDADKAKAGEAAAAKTGKKADKKDPKAGKKEQTDAAGTAATSHTADVPTKPDRSRMVRAGVPMRQRIEPPTEDKGKADSSAKSDGEKKDTASAPNKAKP
jgi:hypothetical protein